MDRTQQSINAKRGQNFVWTPNVALLHIGAPTGIALIFAMDKILLPNPIAKMALVGFGFLVGLAIHASWIIEEKRHWDL
jgi:hypothetical protein